MRQVLLIGKRAAVLVKLQAALRDIGVEADVTQDIANADRGQLGAYSAVAFGRAVPDDVRARMKAAFHAVNPSAVFVDGLAPITPLLVAQFEQALDQRAAHDRRIGDVAVANNRVEFRLRSPAYVQLTIFGLTWLYRTRTRRLLDAHLDAGAHHVDLGRSVAWTRAAFAVVRADAHEVRVLAVRP